MSSHLVHSALGLCAARKPRHCRSRRRAALGGWEVQLLESRALLSTWYVDSGFRGPSEGSRHAPFTAIQAAIDVAASGDTILVETGRGYNESATIDISKSNLTIGADRGAAPVLDGS